MRNEEELRTRFQPISDQGGIFFFHTCSDNEWVLTTQMHKHTLTLRSSPVLCARPVTRSALVNPWPGAIWSSSQSRSASPAPGPCSGSGERCLSGTTGSLWSRRSALSSRTLREAETCPEDDRRGAGDGREREKGPEHLQCGKSEKVREQGHRNHSFYRDRYL